MMFDVMVRVGQNAVKKDIINVYRVHDSLLSTYLRNIQDAGHYIISVIPLFMKRVQPVIAKIEDPIND